MIGFGLFMSPQLSCDDQGSIQKSESWTWTCLHRNHFFKEPQPTEITESVTSARTCLFGEFPSEGEMGEKNRKFLPLPSRALETCFRSWATRKAAQQALGDASVWDLFEGGDTRGQNRSCAEYARLFHLLAGEDAGSLSMLSGVLLAAGLGTWHYKNRIDAWGSLSFLGRKKRCPQTFINSTDTWIIQLKLNKDSLTLWMHWGLIPVPVRITFYK